MPHVADGKINTSHGIFFEEIGKGIPVVLVNGMTRSSRHWLGFERELAKRHRVILIDNRGCGRSQGVKCKTGETIEVMAGDVQQVLDALGIERAHFVGLSLGGMIALATCLAKPTQAASLTMINSSVGGNMFPRLSPKAVAGMLRGIVRKKDLIKIASSYLVSGLSEERMVELIAEWQQIDREERLPFGILKYQLYAAATFRARKRLAGIQFPVLIYCARDDAFVPMINSSLLHAQIPSSEYIVVDRGGHEVTVSQPEDTANRIAEFIDRMEERSRSAPGPKSQRKPDNKRSSR